MPLVWDVPPSKAFTELFDFKTRQIYYKAWDVAKRRAQEIEDWMKANAPWTDRTEKAREGLHVEVIIEALAIHILLELGRDPEGGYLGYGRYLEYHYGERYAIIGPALDHWGPIILADMREVVR